jgi:hypothetical protein
MLLILSIIQEWSLPNQLDETFRVEDGHATALADWQRMAHDASCSRQSKTILVVSGHDFTQLDRWRLHLLPEFHSQTGLAWSAAVCTHPKATLESTRFESRSFWVYPEPYTCISIIYSAASARFPG